MSRDRTFGNGVSAQKDGGRYKGWVTLSLRPHDALALADFTELHTHPSDTANDEARAIREAVDWLEGREARDG